MGFFKIKMKNYGVLPEIMGFFPNKIELWGFFPIFPNEKPKNRQNSPNLALFGSKLPYLETRIFRFFRD